MKSSLSLRLAVHAAALLTFAGEAAAAENAAAPQRAVAVVDGIVQPKRPMVDAIDEAIQFLRKADGAYQPGNLNGELAGYFTSAHVLPDGGRAPRQLSFPARQHAYFIRTFVNYYAYSGEREWLLRARDLADWNIAHSTPPDCALPNVPYSAFHDGIPTGSGDKDSTEPDKAAYLGTYYLAVYELTGDAKYLEAARKIAATVIKWQRPDGSVPFRVVPTDGSIYQEFGGAPVYFVEFFARLRRHDDRPEYRTAEEKAVRLMIARNVEQGLWGTYHEDVKPHDGTHLSAEPMSFTADYLFRASARHPEYIALGRKVLAQMEGKLVFTEGHAAAPAPGVAEQATYMHVMPGHTARYCLALADLYRATGDEPVRRKALSGLNALTYMQSDKGLFRTFFYDTKKKVDGAEGKPDWYSQHLYTVCHLLETTAVFPERVPDGQNRILGFTTAVYAVNYQPTAVSYATRLPGAETIKLAFMPKAVRVGGKPLGSAAAGDAEGWRYDSKNHVLTLRHASGEVTIQ